MTLYHGSRARLREGDLIRPGRKPNPWGDTFDENGRSLYVYATASLNTAECYAAAVAGRGYVYEVEPTGDVLPDYSGDDVKSLHPFRVLKRIATT